MDSIKVIHSFTQLGSKKKAIVPPPKTVSEMIEREASDYEMVDFYLAKKDIPTS